MPKNRFGDRWFAAAPHYPYSVAGPSRGFSPVVFAQGQDHTERCPLLQVRLHLDPTTVRFHDFIRNVGVRSPSPSVLDDWLSRSPRREGIEQIRLKVFRDRFAVVVHDNQHQAAFPAAFYSDGLWKARQKYTIALPMMFERKPARADLRPRSPSRAEQSTSSVADGCVARSSSMMRSEHLCDVQSRALPVRGHRRAARV